MAACATDSTAVTMVADTVALADAAATTPVLATTEETVEATTHHSTIAAAAVATIKTGIAATIPT